MACQVQIGETVSNEASKALRAALTIYSEALGCSVLKLLLQDPQQTQPANAQD